MPIEICSGDLLDQPVEAIVNAWNRNIIPWWLLQPHGVSGAIKRRAGSAPFRELARHGRLRPARRLRQARGGCPFTRSSMWRRSRSGGPIKRRDDPRRRA